jgi:electron transfer flavoprotein alpha subunit
VFVEHRNGKLASGTLNAVTAATKFGGPVSALVTGTGAEAAAAEVAKVAGVGKVLVAKDAGYDHYLPEAVAPLLSETVKAHKISHVVGAHSAVGKNVFPRVAALLDVAPISDILALEGEDTFVRAIYAGKHWDGFGSGERVLCALALAARSFEMDALPSNAWRGLKPKNCCKGRTNAIPPGRLQCRGFP